MVLSAALKFTLLLPRRLHGPDQVRAEPNRTVFRRSFLGEGRDSLFEIISIRGLSASILLVGFAPLKTGLHKQRVLPRSRLRGACQIAFLTGVGKS